LVPAPGASFTGPILGDHTSSDETWGKFVHLGPLQYGQRRDITVQMTLPPGEVPYLEATLEWNHAVSNKAIRITANGIDRNATLESVTGGVRSKMISVRIKAVNKADEG